MQALPGPSPDPRHVCREPQLTVDLCHDAESKKVKAADPRAFILPSADESGIRSQSFKLNKFPERAGKADGAASAI